VSPTKQARGDSSQGTQTPSGDKMENNNLGRNQAQSGVQFSSGQWTNPGLWFRSGSNILPYSLVLAKY